MTSWRRRFAIIVVLLAGIAVLLGTPGPARGRAQVRVELLSEVASIVLARPSGWRSARRSRPAGTRTG
jgi:hypothetical protein